ncbi:sodium:calcium antiporter [Alkalicoccus urumqiensis]|uniref:Cation transporter n=1 Tax=Alkalicoccus urumqiensis TaxID=1548213 RepID=A0A2P6MD72_ALKUR|nr:sodium:calcium antiporter [Alkalicoccus urumqiensis]PRO64212.1 cation transporter [Alkalicoccus urumqiensis]
MIYAIFAVSAVITVIAAVRLSTYADVIGERTSLGGMMAGTILLAGATSLPEVTTSLTAVVVDNPDIAVSNVFGSNLFNMFILAGVDIVYRRKKMLSTADRSQLKTGGLGLVMALWMLTAILFPSGITFLGAGIEVYILVLLYSIGMYWISKTSGMPDEGAELTESQLQAISLRRAKWGFAAAALVIFVTGSALSITGDLIAQATGISSSFVGTFLIAGATSLPELATVIVAVQLANLNMAVGNILGSNVFNMLILFVIDIAYRGGAAAAVIHPVTAVSAGAVILMNAAVLAGIWYVQRRDTGRKSYVFPSLITVLLYIGASYAVFTFSG